MMNTVKICTDTPKYIINMLQDTFDFQRGAGVGAVVQQCWSTYIAAISGIKAS